MTATPDFSCLSENDSHSTRRAPPMERHERAHPEASDSGAMGRRNEWPARPLRVRIRVRY